MDNGKRLILHLLFMGLCGQVKGFDKELEKDSLTGIEKTDLAIYLEKKSDFLHSRIDLKHTVIGLVSLDKWIQAFHTKARGSLDKVLVNVLKKQQSNIVRKLDQIVGRKGDRDKRSIDFLGNLISDLFGNPGPEDWKKNNANILALKQAIKLIGQDTISVHKHIDTNEHEIENNNKEIIRLAKEMDDDLGRVDGQLAMLENYYKLMDIMDTIDKILSNLIRVKLDGEKGYCSSLALDSKFLQKNLQRLEANSMGLSPIFAYWEWRKYYRHQLCTIAMDSNNIWITIRIPMVKKTEKLIRVTPMQIFVRNIRKFRISGLNPILFKGAEQDIYHLMGQKEFDMCTKMGSIRTCNSGQILTVPNSCSVRSKIFDIDEREMDENINRMLSVASDEFSKSNFTLSGEFERGDPEPATRETAGQERLKDITGDLHNRLDSISFEHKNAWSIVNHNLWIVTGVLASMTTIIVLCGIINKCYAHRKNNKRIKRMENALKLENKIDDIAVVGPESSNKQIEDKESTKGNNEIDQRRYNV